MYVHDEALDTKLAPEFGQGEEDEAAEELSPEGGQEGAEEDDEELDDDVDTEDSDEEGEGDGPDDETEEVVPAKQYKELRKVFTQKTMELAELKRDIAKAAQSPPQAPQPQRSQHVGKTLDDVVNEKVAAQMEAYMAPLKQQETDLAIRATVMSLAEGDDDFEAIVPIFLDKLELSPQLFEIEGGIELAYKAARADYLELAQEARVKAETAAAMKRKSMKEDVAEKASSTRKQSSGGSKTDDEDAIKNAIMEQVKGPSF